MIAGPGLPVAPPELPRLEADPAVVGGFASELLAASAQLDDFGSFARGAARLPDWSGVSADAYRDATGADGQRADVMSLALREVAHRAAAHADDLARLRARLAGLEELRAHLAGEVDRLHREAPLVPDEQQVAFLARCDDVAGLVARLAVDAAGWASELAAEEAAMNRSFERVLTLDRVEQRYAGSADPADAALATRPGAGATATEVHAWWVGLSAAAQLAVMAASPGAIGNLDGIPARARDAANTVSLERDLAAWQNLEDQGLLTPDEQLWLENARAARDAVATIRSGLDPVTREPVGAQLYLYEPAAFGGDGAVAVAAGDLDSAHHVSVVVPGFGTDAESAPFQAERVRTLYESVRCLDGSGADAVLSWIGYDAPDNVPWGEGWDAAGVTGEYLAAVGGDHLADAVDGLRAEHTGPPAHLTVIGHSYGSTTAALAAYDHYLRADDLVLVGSPGAGGGTHHAADLGLAPGHVWVGSASRDPVSWLGDRGWVSTDSVTGGGGLGVDPSSDGFGAVRFRAEDVHRAWLTSLDDHQRYFDPGSESLHNLSEVVVGHYGSVGLAGPRHDPWYGPPVDPEFIRRPDPPGGA